MNDRKDKPNHPDYSGKLNVEGKDFYVKGWKKTAKSGIPMMSLVVNPVEGESAPRTEQPKAATAPTNDSEPF